MADGLEKLAEAPSDFLRDGTAFIRKCQKPTRNGT